MRLWCSALGQPWSWTWRPYLGVWLLALALAVAYWRAYRRTPMPPEPWNRRARRWRAASAAAATVLFWVMLDWPVGTLGAGYLASVHAAQFLGLALVVPALALLGLPYDWERGARPRTRALLRAATLPPFNLLAFNAAVLVTHLPWVTDTLMASQAGSFALDMTWLTAGAVFWWPIIRGWPDRQLGPAVKLIYVTAGTALDNLIGIFLVLASSPLYATYELAPPIGRWWALDDQQAAGAIMLFGGIAVVATAVALLVHRWQQSESARLPSVGPQE